MRFLADAEDNVELVCWACQTANWRKYGPVVLSFNFTKDLIGLEGDEVDNRSG